jgi:hypothetical protein
MENQHDPFLALAVAGAATERSNSTPGSRSRSPAPMAVAQIGWDWRAHRRLPHGLGRGCAAITSGAAVTPPAPRMREYAGDAGDLALLEDGREPPMRASTQPPDDPELHAARDHAPPSPVMIEAPQRC